MRVIARALGVLLVMSQPLVALPPDLVVTVATLPRSQGSTGAAVMPPGPTDEQLHQELRDLKAAMEAALNGRDIDALLTHVDERVVFTTMNGDVVTGHAGVRAYFDKMMNGPGKIVESIQASFLPDTLSILHGGNVAVSWGRTADHYELASGQRLAIEARWSATMVRRDGRWLIANFHYSTNMFDNPVLAAQRKLLIGAGVIGALLLGVAGFLLGRRRTGG